MERSKHALLPHEIAKINRQLSQIGGVVFRHGETRVSYETLAEAVAEQGMQILNVNFYKHTNVDAELIYIAGENATMDPLFHDLDSFRYFKRPLHKMKQLVPKTPIGFIEEELTSLLPRANYQPGPVAHYGTDNGTQERGWFEKSQAPASVNTKATSVQPINVREGIERMFHEPQKFNN